MPASSSGIVEFLLEVRRDRAVELSAEACTATPRRPSRAAAIGESADNRRAPRRTDRRSRAHAPWRGRRDSSSPARTTTASAGGTSARTPRRGEPARGPRGASASIRAIAAASAESGRSAMPPESIAERNRSRRNCGFPPERVATTSSTCTGSGVCCGRQLRQPQRILRRERLQLERESTVGRLRRVESGWTRWRRATAKSQGRAPISPVRYDSSSAEASSMWCAFVDLDQLRSGHHDLEEPCDGLVQLRAAVRLAPAFRPRASPRPRRRTRWRSAAATAPDRARSSRLLRARRSTMAASGVVTPELQRTRAAARATRRTASDAV